MCVRVVGETTRYDTVRNKFFTLETARGSARLSVEWGTRASYTFLALVGSL